MITVLQAVALFIALAGASYAIALLKQKKLSFAGLLFWMAVWGSVALIVFIPSISYHISAWFGIKRGIDFLIYFSILVLFYLAFQSNLKISRLEREITKLVREIALKK